MSQNNKPRNILTNPEDMALFLDMVRAGLKASLGQRDQIKEQLKQLEDVINTHENQIALLENWQEIMDGNDLTIINMAFQDIKKNMTKPVVKDESSTSR